MNWDDIVIKCDGKKEYNNKGLMKNMNRKYECEHCGHKPEDGSTVEVKNNKYKCGDCGHFTSFSFGTKDKTDNPVEPLHYTDMAISPHEYNKANKLDWNEANVIKYVSRWKNKNGIEDLKKGLWYLNDLIKGVEEC